MDRFQNTDLSSTPPEPTTGETGYLRQASPGNYEASAVYAWYFHMLVEELRNVVLANPDDPTPVYTALNQVQASIAAQIKAATPDGTEAVKGLVRFATEEEHVDGASTVLACNPAGLKAAITSAIDDAAAESNLGDIATNYQAGDTVEASANGDAADEVASFSYTKAWEMLFRRFGTVRVTVTATAYEANNSGVIAYARIYVNGNPVGAQKTITVNQGTPLVVTSLGSASEKGTITWTEDIELPSSGSRLQVYLRRGTNDRTVRVDNVVVKCANPTPTYLPTKTV